MDRTSICCYEVEVLKESGHGDLPPGKILGDLWDRGGTRNFQTGAESSNKGLKYCFQGTVNAKNLGKIDVSLSNGGYGPLALPLRLKVFNGPFIHVMKKLERYK